MNQAPSSLSRQYVKLCDRRDFNDERLRQMIHEIAPVSSPREEIHRKLWEFAMLGMYLEDVGLLNEESKALAVGAGHEAPLFWLANRIGRIVATDIYGEGTFAEREADPTMLDEPARFAPYHYRESHLEVLSMDARSLEFPDASFDFVFSLSSIEHFGGPRDVARAAQEMARVVRPDGHLLIATEYLLRQHPLNSPKLHVGIRLATGGRRCAAATLGRRATDDFTPKEIERWIIGPLEESGLTLVQPIDTRLSPETYENVIHWRGDGELHPATGDDYPHLVLKGYGAPWTSVFLALRQS